MENTSSVGLHFAPGLLRASHVRDGRISRAPECEVGKMGCEYYWARPAPGQLDYFSIHDLVGVRLEKGSPEKVITECVEKVLGGIPQDGLDAVNVAMAVPFGLHDFQRRRLISILSAPARRLRLIDSAMAALLASQEDATQSSSTLAVVVAEDQALEIVIAHVADGQCQVLAQDRIEELSGRALNHHLMSILISRLPGQAQAALAAGEDEVLSSVLARLAKSRTLLGRVASFGFPIFVCGIGDSAVKLGQSDMSVFFSERSDILKRALAELRRKAGPEGTHIDRVVSVGDFNEFAEWTARLEQELAPVEVAPLSLLADGAAMAASHPSSESGPIEVPEPIPFEPFIRSRSTPMHVLIPTIVSGTDIEGAAEKLFGQVAQLIAQGKAEEARTALNKIRLRTASVLAALTEAPVGAMPPTPAAPVATSPVLPDMPTPQPQTHKSRGAMRALDQAERMLQAGKPLEAVALSHQALSLSGEDHAVLMALLDIHRRSAVLLSGPHNFEAAVTQLRCALQQRQNDAPTRIALADRYVEQALFVEKQGQPEEARNLLEEALLLADDDSVIVKHLHRLGGV